MDLLTDSHLCVVSNKVDDVVQLQNFDLVTIVIVIKNSPLLS